MYILCSYAAKHIISLWKDAHSIFGLYKISMVLCFDMCHLSIGDGYGMNSSWVISISMIHCSSVLGLHQISYSACVYVSIYVMPSTTRHFVCDIGPTRARKFVTRMKVASTTRLFVSDPAKIPRTDPGTIIRDSNDVISTTRQHPHLQRELLTISPYVSICRPRRPNYNLWSERGRGSVACEDI